MNGIRRLLGVFVMIAGVIGLIISLTGMVGVIILRPRAVAAASMTINTLYTSVDASQKTMEITGKTLDATITSVETLSSMLSTSAKSVADTQTVLDQLNSLTGDKLPVTLEAATSSLKAAEGAAKSLEDAIKSFETFQAIISNIPLLNSFVPDSGQKYLPQKPLADSLGELVVSLDGMPATFEGMSGNMEKAGSNLGKIQTDLDTMAENVALIAKGLNEYQVMIKDSQTSMGDLLVLLTTLKQNFNNIFNIIMIALTLFFLWMLATQVVIFSQGWELFQGTASRMETGKETIESKDSKSDKKE